MPPSWRGKSIIEKAVRSKYHISILATKKNRQIYPLPKPEHISSADETLIIIGHYDDVKGLMR